MTSKKRSENNKRKRSRITAQTINESTKYNREKHNKIEVLDKSNYIAYELARILSFSFLCLCITIASSIIYYYSESVNGLVRWDMIDWTMKIPYYIVSQIISIFSIILTTESIRHISYLISCLPNKNHQHFDKDRDIGRKYLRYQIILALFLANLVLFPVIYSSNYPEYIKNELVNNVPIITAYLTEQSIYYNALLIAFFTTNILGIFTLAILGNMFTKIIERHLFPKDSVNE